MLGLCSASDLLLEIYTSDSILSDLLFNSFALLFFQQMNDWGCLILPEI